MIKSGAVRVPYSTIIEKVSSWKAITLTRAGRGLMIKAVIQAMPTHLMSCFLLPSEVVDDLRSLSTKFF